MPDISVIPRQKSSSSESLAGSRAAPPNAKVIMDLEVALEPAGSDVPAGPNLKGTLEWGEFERLAAGKPAQYVGPNLVAAAEEPPWPQVVDRATALLARSKDLRLAVHCTKGLVRTRGWNGLAAGLGLIRGMVERYWNDLHPELDRDDNDDPTMRLNCMADLSEDDATLAAIRNLPVVSSPRAGKLSLRDVLQTRDGAGTPASVVTAVFADADLQNLAITATAVRGAWEHLVAIEEVVAENIGPGHALNVGRLKTLLSDANRLLTEKVASRQPSTAAAGVATNQGTGDEGAAMTGTNGSNGNGASHAVPLGAIRSREDVAKALDAICEYYRVQEPSSPLPLLLNRARRLIAKDFMEIIQDLAPDGVAQVQTIRGSEETKD